MKYKTRKNRKEFREVSRLSTQQPGRPEDKSLENASVAEATKAWSLDEERK